MRKNVSESGDCPLKIENSKISKNSQNSQWKFSFEYRTRDLNENKSNWSSPRPPFSENQNLRPAKKRFLKTFKNAHLIIQLD